jgi:oligopeptide/dipeptide ABC transporter ATP-binding protein
MSAVLSVRELRVGFPDLAGYVHAVNGISYDVDAGETLAIIGESGSGKTVSCRAIAGLLPASAQVSGSVLLNGEELLGLAEKQLRQHRGRDVAIVFQDPARSLNPTMRIGDQIAEAIRLHKPVSRKAAKVLATELLGLVRLSAPARRIHEYPHQLSGGMRQRVMIAIALACQPRVLIADEPTTALDVTTQAQIMELLRDLQAELKMAVLMISHNLALAASYADKVAVMYAGRIVEDADVTTLFTRVRMPYTRLLFEATPRLEDESDLKFAAVSWGAPPDLRVLTEGCAFAPRCPQVGERCRAERPPLVRDADGHRVACWYPGDAAGGPVP